MAAVGEVCAGLIRHKTILSRELSDTNILDVLVKKGIFNVSDLELITSASDSEKCNYFIQVVSKQSGAKLVELCSVLEKECPKLSKELKNDRHRFIVNGAAENAKENMVMNHNLYRESPRSRRSVSQCSCNSISRRSSAAASPMPLPPLNNTMEMYVEPVVEDVLVAMNFFAVGDYQTDVGDIRRHCVAQSSVSKAVKQVTLALNKPEIINKYVCFPFKLEERQQVKREFYRRFKMPGCLACIDGTHVAIVCPHEHEERYYNRKDYHSLNVQLMCDAKLNIMNVDASYPGSTHDSVIWAHHPLNNYLDRLHTVSGEDLYLLGDSGYPLRPIMMTPVSDPDPDSPEEKYQNMHLTARNTVERCIGVLKGRFRCLLGDRKLHYTPTVAARITNACCVLHNIANRHNLPFKPLTKAEAEAERRRQEGASGSMPATGGAFALSQLEMGRARRRALIQRLWENRAVEN